MPRYLNNPASRNRAVLAVILLALALRLAALGQESLWADEYHSLVAATADDWRQTAAIARQQAVQPPYFLLLRAFLRVVGLGDITLRLPSVFFGVLAPLLMYRLVRKLFPESPGRALLAAFLLAVSPMHVWYSQEARPYALLIAVELAMLLALASGLRKAMHGVPDVRRLALAALLAAPALEVHNFAIFPWSACLALLIAFAVCRPAARSSLALPITLFILAAVHPAFTIVGRLLGWVHLDFLPAHYGLSLWHNALLAQVLGPHWSPLSPPLIHLGVAVGAALLGAGLYRLWREHDAAPTGVALVVLGFAATFIAPVTISLIKPIVFHGQRYMIVALPFVVILLSVAATAHGPKRARWRIAALAVVLLLQAAYLTQYYAYRQKHMWDRVAEHLTAHARPDDAIVVVIARNAGLLAHYLPPPYFVGGVDPDPRALRDLLTAERRRVFLVSYADLRPLLAAAEFTPPKRIDLFETHQRGQELWVTSIDPRNPAADTSSDNDAATESEPLP
jgi:uncharacterized membrane protein